MAGVTILKIRGLLGQGFEWMVEMGFVRDGVVAESRVFIGLLYVFGLFCSCFLYVRLPEKRGFMSKLSIEKCAVLT